MPVNHYCLPGFSGRIGVARADITPPIGIANRNWGAATQETATGIHRPLTSTALTLQEQHGDGQPLVLIAADLGWWKSAEDERYVREFVLEALSLDPAHLMIAFSHTHAGPSLCREEADRPGGKMIAPYLDSLRETFVQIARGALNTARNAELVWRYGKCTLAANRDLLDPDAPRYLCGFNPALPADDTLLVGRVTEQENGQGKILATLVNYACHPTTLAWENTLISPDYVGAMREVVEKETENAPCLYLHGASGELAPREQYLPGTELADRNGRELGLAVLSVLVGMTPPGTLLEYRGVVESGAPLAVWKPLPVRAHEGLSARLEHVALAIKSDFPTLAELDEALGQSPDRPQRERLLRKRRIRQSLGEHTDAHIPLWVWQIGEAFLIGQPNEAYSLFQTELRHRFPQNALAVMNVVNGHFGYLPPPKLYEKDIYPVWQTPFAQGSLERLIAKTDQILRA